jgi:hypothetical protein
MTMRRSWSATLRSGPAAPRFVLTEVLADAAGPEPQGEWVEVQNIGTKPGSLEAFELWDEAGGVALPSVVLAPQQFGLVVRDDFAVGPDHVPEAAAVPIVVPTIGKNGLRNSGERVELRDPAGTVQSLMLPLPSSEGVSVARVDAWAPDVLSSFSTHGAKGASPGQENILSSPTESSSSP